MNMELPDDVLAIVREYSRPVFTHYQLYHTAVKVLGIYGRWDALKEKLHTEPEKVIPALRSYQDAFLVRTKLDTELKDFLCRNEPIDEILRIKDLIRKANTVEKKHYQALSAVLYRSLSLSLSLSL